MVTQTAYRLGQLARLVDGMVEGDASVTITGVSSLEDAQDGHIAYLAQPHLRPQGESCRASALIVPPGTKLETKPIIVTEEPRLAFSKVLELFAPERRLPEGIHPLAHVGENVTLGTGVGIGASAFIGNNVIIGDNVVIPALAYIGHEVSIGADCELFPHTYLGDRVILGCRVSVNAGAVIGSDGFGYYATDQGHRKIPQIGTVIVEDDVVVGANSTVDRSTVSATRIGRGTKIDDGVHVAHNVVLGENCLLCGHVGIAGSARIGNNVVMGGKAGINDHITICDNVVIGGGANVYGDIDEPGVYSGTPARPHQENLRTLALQHRIPKLLDRIKELEEKVAELAGKTNQ